jgi:hypothetical protein
VEKSSKRAVRVRPGAAFPGIASQVGVGHRTRRAALAAADRYSPQSRAKLRTTVLTEMIATQARGGSVAGRRSRALAAARSAQGLTAFSPTGLLSTQRREFLDQYERRWADHGLWCFLGRFSVRTGQVLLRADDDKAEALVAQLLERALCDSAVIKVLQELVRSAPIIGVPQREQMLSGLGALHDRRWSASEPLLGRAIEGAYWQGAEALGLIDHRHRPTRGGTGHVAYLDRLFPDMGIGQSLSTFLAWYVVHRRANPYRHGYARDGHRNQTLFYVYALMVWLQRFAPGSPTPLANAMFAA